MIPPRSPLTSLFLIAVALITRTPPVSATRRNVVKVNDQVALEVVSELIVRVFKSNGGDAVHEMQKRNSLVVLEEARDQQVEFTVSQQDDILTVSTMDLIVHASISTGRVRFFELDPESDQKKNLLLKELSTDFGGGNFSSVTQEFSLNADEAIYGGGGYVNGFLNYRSAPILMDQFNTEAAVPFLLSSHKYGILWDLYGVTLMNEPQEEIALDPNTFQGSFTPRADGPHWFFLNLCDPAIRWENFGCGFDPVRVILQNDDGSSRVICEHSLANVPQTIACRVDGWIKGIQYNLTMEGAYPERRLFVTGIATHNKLTFQTRANKVIDYYFMASVDDSLDGVIYNYRRLTGTANLYPRWVYGFWQCKEHYHNQTELLEAAAKFRALAIPVDAIVQDWQYWGDLGWGPQWDSKIYPSPETMIATLHDAGIHFMVSVWSWFDDDTQFYGEMSQAGVLINASNYMDAWNPVAQELFYKFVQENHFSIGADALWLDGTEPEKPVEKGQPICLGSGDEYANTFSLMVTKTVHDGLVQKYPNRRVFSLTRSSFAGQQRYGATIWSGDTTGSWDSLRRQIAMSINYQLSGIPYWSMDTGGFTRPDDQYTNEDYHHLLIRWFQFAVFTPIFRVHGYMTDTELWNYGKSVQNTIVDTAIRFRYRLLEYIYSGYWRVQTEHYTMQRGLILDFGDDENVRDIPDQFMFGESLLVAPIYQADSSRSVYLPKLPRGKWRCFYSGHELEGGQSIRFDNLTVTRIPLFVRSSILVLGPDGRQHVDDAVPNGTLEVRVYDGADYSYLLFEDDGVSADPNRPTNIIPFSWNDQLRTLTVGIAHGVAPRTITVVLVRPGVGVGIDPVAKPDATITYDGSPVTVQLPLIALIEQEEG